MELSKLQIELTRNSPAQAIQLGFSVGRAFYMPLLLAQTIATLPVLLFIFIVYWLVSPASWLWGVLMYWWLLPFIERVMLKILSLILFSVPIRPHDYVDAIWIACKKQLWLLLSLYRFSPSRSFFAPVYVLEQLEGTAASTRTAHLHRSASGFILTVGFFGLRFFLALNFAAIILMIIPSEWWLDSLIVLSKNTYGWAAWLIWLLILANIVLTPFYVATGFMLYLAQRINLEGWDIEINFKLLAARLSKYIVSIAIFAVMTLSGLQSTNLQAATQPAPIPHSVHTADQQALSAIIHDPKVYPYEPVSSFNYVGSSWFDDNKTEAKTIEWGDTAFIGSIVRFVLIAVFIVFVGWVIYRFRDKFTLQRGGDKDEAPPEILFGLDVRKDSATQDILSSAQSAFAAGNFTEALSWLYRGALIDLIHVEALKIKESHTEGDCARMVKTNCHEDKSRYFNNLTHAWQKTVYAHQTVSHEDLAQLLATWSTHFQSKEIAS